MGICLEVDNLIFFKLSSTTLDQSKKAELGGEAHGCSTDLENLRSWGHATNSPWSNASGFNRTATVDGSEIRRSPVDTVNILYNLQGSIHVGAGFLPSTV